MSIDNRTKTINMKTKVILVLLVVLLSACKNLTYRYYTKINADGTILKQVTAEGDSSDVYKNPFSFDVDNGWRVRYDKRIADDGEDTLFVAIAEKVFQNVDEVNRDFTLKVDSVKKDNVVLKLEKHFMGFFTFYRYTEIFQQRFPFRHVSINDYLNEEEYAYFFEDDTTCVQGLTDDEVKLFEERGESKFGNYMMASLGIEFINLLNNYSSEKNKPNISSTDSLFVMQLFRSSVDEEPELEDICALTDERLRASWVSEARCDGYFKHFEEQIENESILFDDNNYYYEVEVPGLLYETNATAIEDVVAKWQFTRGSFLYKDLELTLEYRTINYWFFMVVGVLLVILLVSLIVKRKA